MTSMRWPDSTMNTVTQASIRQTKVGAQQSNRHFWHARDRKQAWVRNKEQTWEGKPTEPDITYLYGCTDVPWSSGSLKYSSIEKQVSSVYRKVNRCSKEAGKSGSNLFLLYDTSTPFFLTVTYVYIVLVLLVYSYSMEKKRLQYRCWKLFTSSLSWVVLVLFPMSHGRRRAVDDLLQTFNLLLDRKHWSTACICIHQVACLLSLLWYHERW